MAGSISISGYGMTGIYGMYGNMRPGGTTVPQNTAAQEKVNRQNNPAIQRNANSQGNFSTQQNANTQGNPSMQGNATIFAGSPTQKNAVEGNNANPDEQVKAGRKSSPSECKTCKERKYQDGSNESDVSFKAPGHISPQASAGAVRAHEMQHVGNAYEKAAKGDGKVVSATVTLRTEICPECGTSYVAGGETRTSIAYPAEENPYQKNRKALEAIGLIGSNIDYVA